MSEWRTMEAGPELDQVVAERLGWTGIHEDEYYAEGYNSGGFETVWVGVPPGGDELWPLPRFSRSVDAALTFPIGDCFWVLSPDCGHNQARASLHPRDWARAESQAYADDHRLAEAMCKAWLSYMEGKDDDA